MNEYEVRRGVNAAITDQVRGFANGWMLGFCLLAFIAHPLLGTILLLVWLALWIGASGLRSLQPSERAYRRDRADWLALHPSISRGGKRWSGVVDHARTEADYLRTRRQEHPSNWQPFEDWRTARRHA